jgi:hypothetical protein
VILFKITLNNNCSERNLPEIKSNTLFRHTKQQSSKINHQNTQPQSAVTANVLAIKKAAKEIYRISCRDIRAVWYAQILGRHGYYQPTFCIITWAFIFMWTK